MEMQLLRYRDKLAHMANMVGELFGIGVIVVDERRNELVNNFPQRYNDVHIDSVITRVIIEGKRMIVKDRKQNKQCQNCRDYYKCDIEAVIGAPIMLEDSCIGAVAFLISQERVSAFNGKFEMAADILEQCTHWIACEIQNNIRAELLDTFQQRMIQAFDFVSSPVVITDEKESILYCNKSFWNMYGLAQQNIRGDQLEKVLRPYRIRQEQEELKCGMVFSSNAYKFFRLASIENINLDLPTVERSYVFVFEQVDRAEISSYVRPLDAEAAVGDFWCNDPAGEQAKKEVMVAIRNNLPVMIEGKDGARMKQLAWLMHSCSPLSRYPYFIVDCDGKEMEIKKRLFGTDNEMPGLLMQSGNGVLCLYKINHLSLYIQERLADYIQSQQVYGSYNYGMIPRIFAVSDEDLEDLVNKNKFSRRLFSHVAQNRIVIPEVRNDGVSANSYINRFIEGYASIYQCKPFRVEGPIRELPVEEDGSVSYISMRRFAEMQVVQRLCENFGGGEEMPLGVMSEETRLREMLQSGISKHEIAETLGVSRATVYRWIEKYDLKENARKKKKRSK